VLDLVAGIEYILTCRRLLTSLNARESRNALCAQRGENKCAKTKVANLRNLWRETEVDFNILIFEGGLLCIEN